MSECSEIVFGLGIQEIVVRVLRLKFEEFVEKIGKNVEFAKGELLKVLWNEFAFKKEEK